ncbi:ATP-binding cassette domain-containing protein [Jannaschia sp. Os4]|uniref:ABC transporter ATP-binding protein n=1 Tax=Jannaschia sp. Os4 TaxID=2807617 RepID=UPI00193ADB39|nr:ATP-binding cassette domain-containing protein [Jannaschia sp. Os4]MBM2576336.1 ATP-binding cassette domain-containing protein [Jannaschia sp. Os4]
MSVLSIDGLVTGFGDRTVHENLSLEMRRGEILGVVGGSGTGKSVLMRAVIGLVAPRAGRIDLLGTRMDAASEAERRAALRRTGIMFQDGALFSSLTLRQNVEAPMRERLPHLDPRTSSGAAELKLALAGLPPEAADLRPSEISGGMRKRAGLARALALDPELVFLDEPTAGLDPIGASAFDRLILDLRAALDLSVFFVTHDLDSLAAICDRVAVLADKRVVAVGTVPELRAIGHPWIERYFGGPRGRAAFGA